MHRRQSVLTLLAALLLAAGTAPIAGCGGNDSSNTNSANNDGANGNNGDNGSNNGGQNGDTDATADAIGSVDVLVLGDGSGANLSWIITANAGLFGEPQVGGSEGDLPTGCTMISDETGYSGPALQVASAGDIAMAIGTKTGKITWDGKEYTGFAADDGAQNGSFTAGEDISVRAPGDVVPAFSGDFKAPSVIGLTFGSTTMKTSSDYVLTWAAGAASEHVWVEIDNTNKQKMRCIFDADKGTGTIPKDVLATLGAGEVTVSALSLTATRVLAGANKVDFTARVTFMPGVAMTIE